MKYKVMVKMYISLGLLREFHLWYG